MNRSGTVESSPVQQMMAAAGNPNWWNINHHQPPSLPPSNSSSSSSSSSPPFFFSSSSSSTPNNNIFLSPYFPSSSSNSLPSWHVNQDHPLSWSQLLMGEDDKKMGNWHEQVMMSEAQNVGLIVDVKKESSSVENYVCGGGHGGGAAAAAAVSGGGGSNWCNQNQIVAPSSSSASPKSCVTSFSSNNNNMLDFCSRKTDSRHPPPDRSSECNSNGGGGAVKKARVQPSTTTSQSSTFKVRKEKLGDRITALHQLVSPFGKTDTASVLLESIGYIRFLQTQIEALSLPYLATNRSSSSSNIWHQHSVQGENNCILHENPSQELEEEEKKDLKSRGLCLVPVSCTLQVGSDNGADYWAPALGGGGGFR